MDEILKKPHKLVLDRVQQRWSSRYSKSFLTKLTDFILIRPAAIEIVQTASDEKGFKFCTGETLNRWRYNDAGLQIPSPNTDNKQKVEYCYYCIDQKKKKLAISWAKMFSGALRGSKTINYFHDGTVYEIVERNGVEEYNLISCWME
ncbi:MAG: hypothetical protein Q7T74_03115 [Candidatus Saccharibacteria bacterium]|nr:hypothetical protein [Candidatus Saccharibacteria bacterium]